MVMNDILIVGGGIGGLTLALAFGIAAGAATRAWLLRRPV
jgi:2-polyprenyl-6-methoxyphenol hydroxylase-like FAD-dependent oxidoreductase